MRRGHHEKDHGYGLDVFKGFGGTKPTLPMIIILILIILQFSNGKFGDGKFDGFNGENNGILFIIAIFFLSCGCIGKSDSRC